MAHYVNRPEPRKIKIIQPERSRYVPRSRMLRGTGLAALASTMDPERLRQRNDGAGFTRGRG